MQKFIWFLLGAVTMIGYWLYTKYQAKKRIKKKLRDQWGKPRDKSYNWEIIRSYHGYLKSSSNNNYIDDETWEDLNFNAVFSKIDHTVSTVGGQVLFDLMHTPLFDKEELERRKQFLEAFKDEDLRSKLQYELDKLSDVQIGRLPNLLYRDSLQVPAWYNGLLAIPFLTISCIILGFINLIFFLGLGIIPIVNLVIQYTVGNRVKSHTLALSSISPLLNRARAISQLDSDNSNPLGTLGDDISRQTNKLSKL